MVFINFFYVSTPYRKLNLYGLEEILLNLLQSLIRKVERVHKDSYKVHS